MSWFIYALLAPIFWGMLTIIDKYFMTKHFRSPLAYQIFLGLTGVLFIVGIPLLGDISLEPLSITVPVAIGLSWIFLGSMYNKALQVGESTTVISLIYVYPVFVLALSMTFFGEVFSGLKYLGVSFLISSAFLASYKPKHKLTNKVTIFSLVVALWWAIHTVLAKWLFEVTTPISFFFWLSVGNVIGSLILLTIQTQRAEFLKVVKKLNIREWCTRLFAMVVFATAEISFYMALESGPATLVSAMPAIQPLIVFIYVVIISVLFPRIIHEEYTRFTLALRFIATVLIFVGTYLIVT